MIERKRADIDIYTPDGTDIILTVPIKEENRRTVKLMEEDSIELHFTTDHAVYVPVGSYVDDEIFGRFYVTEEQLPEYDTATAGHRYMLKMEAFYRTWTLKTFMLVDGGRRKESEWSLTTPLREHLRQVMLNLQGIGYCKGCDFLSSDTDLDRFISIGSEVDTSAAFISYSSCTILDALKTHADTFSCEYWVTGTEEDFVIHFGKCEMGTEIPLTLEEYTDNKGEVVKKNMESITASRDELKYADKIYAYGGVTNVPLGYRKRLRGKIAEKKSDSYINSQGVRNTTMMYRLDGDRKFENSMFSMSSRSFVLTGVCNDNFTMKNAAVDMIRTMYHEFSYFVGDIPEGGDTSHYDSEFVLPYPDTSVSSSQSMLSLVFSEATAVMQRSDAQFEITLRVFTEHEGVNADNEVMWYQDNTLVDTSVKFDFKDYQNSGNNIISLTGHIIDIPFTPAGIDGWNVAGKNRIQCYISLYIKAGDVYIYTPWECTAKMYNKIELKSGSGETARGVPFTWTFNGATLGGVLAFNPWGQPKVVSKPDAEGAEAVPNYHWWFFNPVAPNSGWSNLAVGDEIEIDTTGAFNVPSAYYIGDYDDPQSVKRIGDNRLRLPRGRREIGDWVLTDEGYVIHRDMENTVNANWVRELSVNFDDIYPEGKLVIKDVLTEEATERETFEGESEERLWDFHKYHLHLKLLSGGDFKFNDKYIMSDTELSLRFIIPEDAGDTLPDTNGYRLTGMTFGVKYAAKTTFKIWLSSPDTVTSEQDFLLVRNEKYGAKLPNETLRPSVGDPCVLEGWNVRALAGLGLVDDAEERLLQRTVDYLSAMREGSFTFNCSMMSDFLFDLYGAYVNLASCDPSLLTESGGRTLVVKNGYTAYILPQLGQKVCVKHQALPSDKHTRVIGVELKMDKPYDSPLLICGETEAYSRLKKIEKQLNILTK